jgi:Ni/Fe-hydrogenase subunit HybB-like protein
MLRALIAALIVFAVTLAILMLVERYVHKLVHNPYKNYEWGVWLFAILLSVYTFVTNLGIG